MASLQSSEASQGRHDVVIVKHKSALFTAELKPYIDFSSTSNAEQQDVGEEKLRNELQQQVERARKGRNNQLSRRRICEDGIMATLYSPGYFGLELPVVGRAQDRLSATKAAHYCKTPTLCDTYFHHLMYV